KEAMHAKDEVIKTLRGQLLQKEQRILQLENIGKAAAGKVQQVASLTLAEDDKVISPVDVSELGSESLKGKHYACITGVHFDARYFTLSTLAKVWKADFNDASVVQHSRVSVRLC